MKKNRFELLLTALLVFCCVAFLEGILTSDAQARPRTQQMEEEEPVEEEVVEAPRTKRPAAAAENEAAPVDEAAEDEDTETFDPNAPIPEPERVFGARLECKDGVQLSATYYPGNRGKKNVPVIILHDWGGTRADVAVLAKELQANGCSVITPDLRGHGKSINRRIGPEDKETFSAKERVNAADLQEIVMLDLPCIKKFLLQKNNEGDLNIDKLIVGGVGYGGLATAFFANNDWNPNVKRNKAMARMGDVKGYFLVAPPTKLVKGANFAETITYPTWATNMSCIIFTVGAKGNKLGKVCETYLRKTCGRDAIDTRCWVRNYDAKGDGADVLQDPDSDFVLDILAFVDKRGAKRDLLWKSR